MLVTNEIDLFSPNAPDPALIADLIQGTLGEGSQFHKTFNYAADGVEPSTAKMPSDWQTRTAEYTSPDCPGVTLIVPDPDPDPNDIAIAKLVAWREKDRHWLSIGLTSKILSLARISERLPLVPVADADAIALAELQRRLSVLAATLHQDAVQSTSVEMPMKTAGNNEPGIDD